ncbi:MAG: hypothetical protein FJ014_02945 [Chloroflexi bacterium]|nr:hypothetical protein [Chloroflexota bacterium]
MMIHDTPKGTPERRDYLSYLLRLWRVGKEEAVWRASIESPHTGQRIGFASLEDLFTFLEKKVCQVVQGQTTPGAGGKGGNIDE